MAAAAIAEDACDNDLASLGHLRSPCEGMPVEDTSPLASLKNTVVDLRRESGGREPLGRNSIEDASTTGDAGIPVVNEDGRTSTTVPDLADPDGSAGEEMCRICLEGPSTRSKLITPCWCKGSVKYVHKRCLEGWLEWKGSPTCELCGYTYTVKRTPLTFREWFSHSLGCNFMKEAVFLGFWCSFLLLLNIMSIEPAYEGWRGTLSSDDLIPLLQLVVTGLAILHNVFLFFKCCIKLFFSVKYCCNNHTHVALLGEKNVIPRPRSRSPPAPRMNQPAGMNPMDQTMNTLNVSEVLSPVNQLSTHAIASGPAASNINDANRSSLDAPQIPNDADFMFTPTFAFGLGIPPSTTILSVNSTGNAENETMRRRLLRTQRHSPSARGGLDHPNHAYNVVRPSSSTILSSFTDNAAINFISTVGSNPNADENAESQEIAQSRPDFPDQRSLQGGKATSSGENVDASSESRRRARRRLASTRFHQSSSGKGGKRGRSRSVTFSLRAAVAAVFPDESTDEIQTDRRRQRRSPGRRASSVTTTEGVDFVSGLGTESPGLGHYDPIPYASSRQSFTSLPSHRSDSVIRLSTTNLASHSSREESVPRGGI